jgi:protein-disulfide isomerase
MPPQSPNRAARPRWALIGVVVALVALVVAIAAVILSQGESRADASDETGNGIWYGGGAEGVVPPALTDVVAPAAADDAAGIPMSAAGVGEHGQDTVAVEVFFDLLCPWCAAFELQMGPVLDELVADGQVTVVHRPVAFLDAHAGGTYSTRAANAVAVVADRAPESYLDFVRALFHAQPGEDTEDGLTDDEIAELATHAGVPDDVVGHLADSGPVEFRKAGDDTVHQATSRTFAPWVAAATALGDTELDGLRTPTVRIDGEVFEGDWRKPGVLEGAVADARG